MKRIDKKSVVMGGEKELSSLLADNSLSGRVPYASFFDSISPQGGSWDKRIGRKLSEKKTKSSVRDSKTYWQNSQSDK